MTLVTKSWSWLRRTFPLFLLNLLVSVVLAQIPTIPVSAPPGTSSGDVALVTGWVFWCLAFVVLALVLVALFTMARHPAAGIGLFVAAILCGIAASNATGITRVIYHPS